MKTKLRYLNWLLVAALILSVFPLAPSKTEGAPQPSVYFQFRDFSIDMEAPTEINSNIVDIVGTFNDVTPSTITYKIEQITVTGPAPGVVKVNQTTDSSAQPILSGQTYSFPGVSLYPGLNRITILGVSSNSNIVSGVAFVNFNNVPAITEIRLTDGRDLMSMDTQPVTTNINEGLTIKAPNATQVFINGKEMFGGANSSFVLSNLGLVRGNNKLTIVARNANKTYEITKELVYFDGTMTAYDVKIDGVPIDGNVQISQSGNLAGVVTAKLIVPISAAPLANNGVTFDVYGGAYNYSSTLTTVSAPEVTPAYSIYTVTDDDVGPVISTTGQYTVRVRDIINNSNFSTTFSYRNTNDPYITDVKQAYGVTLSGNAVSYTSIGSFHNNANISQLPLWLVVESANFNKSAGHTVTVTASRNGTPFPAAQFTYNTYETGPNGEWGAIIISKLPSGIIDLDITITRGGQSDTIRRTINYHPVSSIQVDSLVDGDIFYSQWTAANTFFGKLINFDVTNDNELDTLMLNFNGVDYPLIQARVPGTTEGADRLVNGGFAFNPLSTPVGGHTLNLVLGANTLTFKGVANGIPVSTIITVYYFPGNNPTISDVRPIPHVTDPNQRLFNDPNARFVSTGTKQYNTTETIVDLLFTVSNITNASVQVDGKTVGTVSEAGVNLVTVDSVPTDTISLNFETSGGSLSGSVSNGEGTYTLRLMGVPLPKTGQTNFTITVQDAGAQIIDNLTIIRDLSPYIVLSPKLPEESVINSNFLPISIKAEGADSVMIGKEAMVKGEDDIFRYELKNLKAGVNRISFTVNQGTQKINGSFTVNYAADNSLNAEYKSTIGKSGKLSMFKGDLSVTFPKNTFLRQANANPGEDVKTVDLFDSQELYFAIADRADGRTRKKYNAVGEFSGTTPLDGTIVDVAPDAFAIDRLRPLSNFAYASNLYWVDAGYYVPPAPNSSTFTLTEAKKPYASGSDIFYIRSLNPSMWLEPSQRGTITIRYDTHIVDALAPNLSVWRFTGSQWQNIGGVVNTRNKTVTAPFDGFGYYAVMALRYSFSDIQTHSFARNAMETMFARGIMQNKDNNAFGAYDNITRGEFAQMLVKIMDVPLDYNPDNMTFDDVQPFDYPNTLWSYKYIETAVRKGFIRGKSPRLFFPNDPLTRQEAAIMIARAFNLVKNNADAEKDKAALQKLYTDAGLIDIYGASAILAVTKEKYLSGYPNTTPPKTNRFEPGSYLSRAEAAVIANKIMVAEKKL